MKCLNSCALNSHQFQYSNTNVFLHFWNPAWWQRSILLDLFPHSLCFQTACWKKTSKLLVWEDTKLLQLICYSISTKAKGKIWYWTVICSISLQSLHWLWDGERACDSFSFEKAVIWSWWGGPMTTHLYLKRLTIHKSLPILSSMPQK